MERLERAEVAMKEAAERTRLLCAGRCREEAAQGEPGVARDDKLLVGHGGEGLEAFHLIRALLQADEALRDVEGQIDERTVGMALDLKVLEENVRLEKAKDFINDIIYVLLHDGRWTSRCRLERQHSAATAREQTKKWSRMKHE